MEYVYVTCPHCHEPTIGVAFTDEMQGDGPWAALVTFAELAAQRCDCVLSADEEDDAVERAWARHDSK